MDSHSRNTRSKNLMPMLPVALALVLTSCLTAVAADSRSDIARVAAGYGKLPLSFEANQGQTDKQVKFLSRGPGYALFLTPTETVLSLKAGNRQQAKSGSVLPVARAPKETPSKAAVLRIRLERANATPEVSGIDELAGKSNYFIGKDPVKWRRDIPTFGGVRYRQVYSGVDLVYYGNQRQLEYDFVVAPGADPRQIELSFGGAKRLRLDADGNLVVSIAGGDVIEHTPVIYQDIGGMRRRVAGGYELRNGHTVGFKLAAYDHGKRLTIDPSLVYSTYLGGSSPDYGQGIAADSSGNAYVTGYTFSEDFPTTSGAFQTFNDGSTNVFVTKLDSGGNALLYSTYLGAGGDDHGNGIAVDSSGDAYVTGYTANSGSRFPTTSGAFQNTSSAVENAFVTKLGSGGDALVYSTYLGGSVHDTGYGIAVDSSGNAYVTGDTDSSNFPTTSGAFQTALVGTDNAFVTELDSGGDALVYSTYLGGSSTDYGQGIALDSSGNAYVTGYTDSTNFPVTTGAYQTTYGGGTDNAFVTAFNSSGNALIYSTYLGGSGTDYGYGIAVDSSGNAYVTGATSSTNFPTTAGAYQTTSGGAFVTKLHSGGHALVYSTYLDAGGRGIAVDSSGNAYVTGGAGSGFPTTSGAYQTTFGGIVDAFVTKFDNGGDALTYSTYLGGSGGDVGRGIAVDSSGNAYVTGITGPNPLTNVENFPTTSGAYQTTYGGGVGGGAGDAFVAKFAFGPVCSVTYNGTFKGNLNVSSGTTCTIGGTITGNVSLNGGNFFASNATIGGNLQITGGTFSIGSTAINGNLQIQNIPAGTAPSQVCGTTVHNNLQFQNNGSPVLIGSGTGCAGNYIGGNLTIQNNTAAASAVGNTVGNNLTVQSNTAATIVNGNTVTGNLQDQKNTAPTQVFTDMVGNNLQCQQNSSIAGGGDTAKSLQGQCASF